MAYCIKNSNIHLAGNTRQNIINHINWRVFFCNHLQKPVPATDLHYTATHSLSESDAIKLRDMLIKFIEDTRATVTPSKEEKSVALTLDYTVFEPQ